MWHLLPAIASMNLLKILQIEARMKIAGNETQTLVERHTRHKPYQLSQSSSAVPLFIFIIRSHWRITIIMIYNEFYIFVSVIMHLFNRHCRPNNDG